MQSSSIARLFGALLAAGIGVAPAAAQEGATLPAVGALAAVPPAPSLAPDAAALKAALPAAMAELPADRRSAIDGFFAARSYAPFWTEPGSARPDELVAALEAADGQGLPRSRYAPDALALMFDTPEGAAAAREVAAMGAYLGLATDLSVGIVDPAGISPEISLDPKPPAPSVLLAALADAPVPEALRAFAPTGPDYARLVAEKARLEALAQEEAWGPAVSDGETLHPGDSDSRVAELRARLARLGYVVPTAGTAGEGFDDALAQSVRTFQEDYGLVGDGVVGSRTLAAVNAPVETRLAQVVVNLERMRWMPRDLGERYLYVNIPTIA